MSGCKNTGMSQEEYQAMLAFGAFEEMPYDEHLYDKWDELSIEVRASWMRAASVVRSDTRTEPVLT